MFRIALQKATKPFASNFIPRYSIGNWKLPSFEIDTAGISGFLDASTDAHLTFAQKMSDISFKSLYHGLDQWTRELLLTLSVDLNCGFATSIIIATIAIKTVFLYPTLKGQLMGLRQAELKGLSEQYRQKMKVAQMTNNKALMSQATYDYKMSLKKRGINNTLPMLNFFQVPILITWFLSLRYMSNLPQIYPQLLTDGYLWFGDLSTYDPYFVLPVLAACTTSLSIARSPNLARNNVSIPFLAPYVKYLKFMPFASLAFTSFFPASINLYWLTLAGYQLMTTQLMYSSWVRRKLGGQRLTTTNKPNVIDTAVFVSEKRTSESIMKDSQQKSKAKEKKEEDEEQQISAVKKNQFQKTDKSSIDKNQQVEPKNADVKKIKVLRTKPPKKTESTK